MTQIEQDGPSTETRPTVFYGDAGYTAAVFADAQACVVLISEFGSNVRAFPFSALSGNCAAEKAADYLQNRGFLPSSGASTQEVAKAVQDAGFTPRLVSKAFDLASSYRRMH